MTKLTSLNPGQIADEAHRLDQSEQNVSQIQATTVLHPAMTIEDAYHIQDAWVQLKINRGAQIIGHKIGLTSKVMQRSMSIDEPDFGVLLDDMQFGEGSEINCSRFTDPRIEVELAFVLSNDLEASELTTDSLLESTEAIFPALELIAARTFRRNPHTGYVRTVKDTISDNAANAGIILGQNPLPHDLNLSWVGTLLSKNGVIEESGVSGAVLGHPARSIIWLAKKYAQFGRTLKKGQIILSGSFTRPVTVSTGDEIKADFGKFGSVNCSFK